MATADNRIIIGYCYYIHYFDGSEINYSISISLTTYDIILIRLKHWSLNQEGTNVNKIKLLTKV